VDGKHRTLQHVRSLFGEQAGKLCFLARFQDQDAVAVQSVSHDIASLVFSLTSITVRSFILILLAGLAQGGCQC
jgi:hypothetical protein